MTNPFNFVFLHGGGQAGWVWDECIAALCMQAGERIGATLALDAPGCGAKRGRNTENLNMADVVRELIADIENAGLNDVILVGHSQAGQPIPMMARLRPDLFRRLVYVSCSAPLPGQSVSQMIGKSLQGTHENEVGWPVDPATTSMEERFALMFCNDMSNQQAREFLGKLGKDSWPLKTYAESAWNYENLDVIPATYVVCMRDKSLPAAWQEIFADRLAVERIVRIDAGHQVMNSRPQALAEILLIEAAV
jgi:pimeloyl-ACP methyl ester carboxylesterase